MRCDYIGRGYFINAVRVHVDLMINSLRLKYFIIGKMGESRSLQIDMPIYILTAAPSAAAVVLLVLSIIIFITGFACGHCHGRKFAKGTCHSKADRPCQVPLYDDVLPSTGTHQEQALKLKENVAYLPSRSMVTEDQ